MIASDVYGYFSLNLCLLANMKLWQM